MTSPEAADRLEDDTITISRIFAAPRETVFRLWTDAAYVAQWWGIEDSINPICQLDARPGGDWRIDMQTKSGRVYRNHGVYLEVVENLRLVFTDIPDPALPEWNGAPPAPSVHTVTFADHGDATLVTLEIKLGSRADRDRMLKLGMKTGINQGFDRLERLLVSLAKGRELPIDRRADGHSRILPARCDTLTRGWPESGAANQQRNER